MTINGRAKGNSGEREVAALLKKWWEQLEPDCQFVRTPLSGGFSTPVVRAGFRMSGDLMTTAKKFPFSVEAKRREGWAMENFIQGRKSPVWGWWEQTLTAAVEMNAEPMTWLRKNRKEWYVLIRNSFVPTGLPLFAEWRVNQLPFDPEQEWPVCLRASVVLETPPSIWI